ncbi:MAG TPA: phosphoribosyltransferase family protein [Marmoricola sp.]|nr:phosphoribosyltransferase family protein [Marmoricola sp.]
MKSTSETSPFVDRVDAGRHLAAALEHLRSSDPIVLGLPRGGVPVAYEVAKALDAPLDVIVVRKLGIPFQPEVAMGAIAEGGFEVLDHSLIARLRLTERQIRAVATHEQRELDARNRNLRQGHQPLDLRDRVVIIVDDGLATGATARVACAAARHLGARRIIVAVPVGPPNADHMVPAADDVICVRTPDPFLAVGYHYRDFQPTTDAQVIALLDAARHDYPRMAFHRTGDISIDDDVVISVEGVHLDGHLRLPPRSRGIVIFAHGSGSSRHSPRNLYVAEILNAAGLGTLLMDLLTEDEGRQRANVFDVSLLARRLKAAVRTIHARPGVNDVGIGLFGASTGAAAALIAASDPSLDIRAVVSRGGRPDLAGPALPRVSAPTLLIVGGDDHLTLRLNTTACEQLGGHARLLVVPGATHLFEEPGTLATAAGLAASWFGEYLPQDQHHGSAPAELTAS